MTRTKDILELLNTIAPFDLAENWDNCGLQCGDLDWEVTKILVALDGSAKVMHAAGEWGANMVVTHHPLMIGPVRYIDFSKMPGRVIGISYARQISLVSVHTNLDKATNGLNDYFAALLGIITERSLLPSFPSVKDVIGSEKSLTGIGRIGYLKNAVEFSRLVRQIKTGLNIPTLKVAGDTDMMVKTIAVCTGSGGSLIDEFISSNAQLYITGDIKYHEARQIEELGRGLIDVGHFGSEHIAVDLLSERLRTAVADAGFNVEIKDYRQENDPFIIM